MHRTDFAGLTSLGPGDPLSTDGYSFQGRNPDIIDHFLKLIVTHRHDAHPALANPATDPTVAVDNAGGTIPADTQVTIGYTLLDQDDGETLLNPVTQVVTTQAGLADPTSMPVLALDNTAGGLLANSYSYGVTVTDGVGGETILGTVASIDVPPGNANSEVHISGLSSIPAEVGGVGWRLWRSVGGDAFALVASSADGTTDAVTDDGSLPCDCGVSPPSVTGSSKATSRLRVTVPVGQPADAVQFRIYASLDGTFADPCLLGTYPIADQGTEKTYTSLAFLAGSPPEVATTVPGSAMIAGGGGGTGPLVMMDLNADPQDATNSVIWMQGTEQAVRLTGIKEEMGFGGQQADYNTFHAGDFNPSPRLFDVGQPPNDFGGVPSYLVPKAGTAEADFHGILGGGLPLIGEGFIEGVFILNTVAAGWDEIGVGWGTAAAPLGMGLFAIMDRASGELRLVDRGVPGGGYTVLASAAFSGIADGNIVHIRITRTNAVGLPGTYDYAVTATVGKTTIATIDHSDSIGYDDGTGYPHVVLGWTDPTALGVDSVGTYRTSQRRRVELDVMRAGEYSYAKTLLDDSGGFGELAKQAAAIVNADGTSDGVTGVRKPGVGTYEVVYSKPLAGVPTVITDPGSADGAISESSMFGFTITFAADTAFRFIAVVN